MSAWVYNKYLAHADPNRSVGNRIGFAVPKTGIKWLEVLIKQMFYITKSSNFKHFWSLVDNLSPYRREETTWGYNQRSSRHCKIILLDLGQKLSSFLLLGNIKGETGRIPPQLSLKRGRRSCTRSSLCYVGARLPLLGAILSQQAALTAQVHRF